MADYALFLEPDETAFELFARVVVEPVYLGIPFLDQGALLLRPGHVVELSGQSGTAKSDLLLQVRGLSTRFASAALKARNTQMRPAFTLALPCRLPQHASCRSTSTACLTEGAKVADCSVTSDLVCVTPGLKHQCVLQKILYLWTLIANSICCA